MVKSSRVGAEREREWEWEKEWEREEICYCIVIVDVAGYLCCAGCKPAASGCGAVCFEVLVLLGRVSAYNAEQRLPPGPEKCRQVVLRYLHPPIIPSLFTTAGVPVYCPLPAWDDAPFARMRPGAGALPRALIRFAGRSEDLIADNPAISRCYAACKLIGLTPASPFPSLVQSSDRLQNHTD